MMSKTSGQASGAVAREVNFDGLVGPTHNYAGLSYGNIASTSHGGSVSNPRAAALEGLAKMRRLMALGLTQGVLPPRERPSMAALRAWGFEGSDAAVLERAHRDAPALLAAACSASSMWAANAATVSPSADTADGRVHFTAANLLSHAHRTIEADETTAILRAIFPDEARFAHHPPAPGGAAFADEGAANHTRLAAAHGRAGVELFVYGRSALHRQQDGSAPRRFPARQTLEASQTIARSHRLDPHRVVFAKQHPEAIDAGVFHNDVIAVGNRDVLLCHEKAWEDQARVLHELQRAFVEVCGEELVVIEVKTSRVAVDEAVRSYLFNSQLVCLPDGCGMALIYPTDCDESALVRGVIEEIVAGENPIVAAHAVDVRQSMRNGGGPACLRLRVVLNDEELAATHPGVILTAALSERLERWICTHYREELRPDDLRDVKLLEESRAAMEELEGILGLAGMGAVWE